MAYPAQKPWAPKYFFGEYFTPAGDGYASVSFKSGAYRYAIQVVGTPERSFNGVVVFMREKVVSTIECSEVPTLSEANGIGFIELAQRLERPNDTP